MGAAFPGIQADPIQVVARIPAGGCSDVARKLHRAGTITAVATIEHP